METQLKAWRASVERLHQLVRGLDDAQLALPSYCDDWTIADVVAHVGLVAVLLARGLQDALAGTETPSEFAAAERGRWKARTARAKVDDALVEDERLVETLEAVRPEDRARVTFPFGPLKVSFDEAVALGLNEHVVHTWDVEVMFDPEARLPHDAAVAMIDHLGLIGRVAARPTGDEREIRLTTTHPERHFTVRLVPAGAELLAGDAGAGPDVELPAEAFCRLVYGRLDPDHSPPVRANGEVLDVLRQVFPGV